MNAKASCTSLHLLAALTLCGLCACTTAPPTTIVRDGYSLTLPPAFTDVTGPSIERFNMSRQTLAPDSVVVEPILMFEGASEYRNSGGCSVARAKVPASTTASSLPLPELVRAAGSSLVQQWRQRGRDEPFNPWTPAQSIEPQRRGPLVIAGLPGWQETWHIEWAQQPGPIQPVSLMMVWLADLPGPRNVLAHRPLLQITCGTADLPGYLDTALNEVVDVITQLQPWATSTAGAKP